LFGAGREFDKLATTADLPRDVIGGRMAQPCHGGLARAKRQHAGAIAAFSVSPVSLFRLETPWGFFAPVGKHAQFRYVVEDAAGNTHTFVPSEEASRSIARYVWWREFKYLNDGIMANPEFRGDPAVALLCERHASLRPLAVTLLEVTEQNYGPQDELLGKRPLDPEFVAVIPLRRVACPSGSAFFLRPSVRSVGKPS
jgi:hypothetical protein